MWDLSQMYWKPKESVQENTVTQNTVNPNTQKLGKTSTA